MKAQQEQELQQKKIKMAEEKLHQQEQTLK